MPVFEVGMGTDQCRILAPSAGAAAMYYGLVLVNTNNPFMAAVYTEDGKPFEGDAFWLNFNPTEEHVKSVADRVKDDLPKCHLLEEVE